MAACCGGLVFLVALAVITAQDSTAEESKVSTCTEEFRGQTPKHTLCYEDHDSIVEEGVSAADIKEIVAFHNKVRREVKPVATDLTAVVWDETLAMLAQKWAKQCTVNHDFNKQYRGFGKSINQNIAAGQPNWARAMKSWLDESNFFKYGQDPNEYLAGQGGWTKIAHYTLLVNNRTHRIGCGFARCENVHFGRFYVCNYARGQLRSAFKHPYTTGPTRCSACPGQCKNGLCDCGGRMCMNEGIPDISTCTCKCQRVYAGPDCTELQCPINDKWFCGRRPDADCTKYSNIPFDCPNKCGICPAS